MQTFRNRYTNFRKKAVSKAIFALTMLSEVKYTHQNSILTFISWKIHIETTKHKDWDFLPQIYIGGILLRTGTDIAHQHRTPDLGPQLGK